MNYWKGRGWPTEKLMLGIPNYGRRIRANRFGDAAPPAVISVMKFRYSETQTFIKNGWKTMLDKDAQAPYLVKPEGGELLTYDDEASVRAKAPGLQQAACALFLLGNHLRFRRQEPSIGSRRATGLNDANGG